MVKKKKEPTEEKSEEAQPQITQEKAKDALTDLLSDAATSRTESIKLSHVAYASELSTQLLEHAAKLEKFYQDIQKALGESDDKVLKSLLAKLNKEKAFTAQAKAGLFGMVELGELKSSGSLDGLHSMILPSIPNQRTCLLYLHVLAPGSFSGFFEANKRWEEKDWEEQVKVKGF